METSNCLLRTIAVIAAVCSLVMGAFLVCSKLLDKKYIDVNE